MQNNHGFFNKSAEKIANNFFNKIKYGNLKVFFPSGKVKTYYGNKQGVNVDIKLNNFLIVSKLLRKGSIGFAESYMDEDYSTSNLKNLLIFARQNEPHYINNKHGKWMYKLLIKINNFFNQNTKQRSKKHISHHYDLGNKFYQLWLDNSMSYSSGFFLLPEDDLSKAQLNKYSKIIEPMKLNDNNTLLDIGCGWGGFSSYVAKNYGTQVKAITNSKNHFEYTSQMISKEGLNEKVKVEFKDYRDIDEKFDYISSIEMFEAVGIKYWPIYFDKIKNCLNCNGMAALQIISIDENKREFYEWFDNIALKK